MLLTQDIAEKAREMLPAQDAPTTVAILTIIVGRLLHMQENGDTVAQFQEIQKLAASALACLPAIDSTDEIATLVNDVIRSLPARTANEIHLAYQVALDSQGVHLKQVCAWALLSARPGDTSACEEIKDCQASTVEEVRKAAEKIVQRQSKGTS